MITITPLAQEKLAGYLAENKVEPRVRVYLPSGGCCGGGDGQLSLTLDTPDDDDITIKAGDLELFIEKQLSDIVGKVVIDFKEEGADSGFVVESEHPAPVMEDGGCDCGGGCSGCGC